MATRGGRTKQTPSRSRLALSNGTAGRNGDGRAVAGACAAVHQPPGASHHHRPPPHVHSSDASHQQKHTVEAPVVGVKRKLRSSPAEVVAPAEPTANSRQCSASRQPPLHAPTPAESPLDDLLDEDHESLSVRDVLRGGLSKRLKQSDRSPTKPPPLAPLQLAAISCEVACPAVEVVASASPVQPSNVSSHIVGAKACLHACASCEARRAEDRQLYNETLEGLRAEISKTHQLRDENAQLRATFERQADEKRSADVESARRLGELQQAFLQLQGRYSQLEQSAAQRALDAESSIQRLVVEKKKLTAKFNAAMSGMSEQMEKGEGQLRAQLEDKMAQLEQSNATQKELNATKEQSQRRVAELEASSREAATLAAEQLTQARSKHEQLQAALQAQLAETSLKEETHQGTLSRQNDEHQTHLQELESRLGRSACELTETKARVLVLTRQLTQQAATFDELEATRQQEKSSLMDQILQLSIRCQLEKGAQAPTQPHAAQQEQPNDASYHQQQPYHRPYHSNNSTPATPRNTPATVAPSRVRNTAPPPAAPSTSRVLGPPPTRAGSAPTQQRQQQSSRLCFVCQQRQVTILCQHDDSSCAFCMDCAGRQPIAEPCRHCDAIVRGFASLTQTR